MTECTCPSLSFHNSWTAPTFISMHIEKPHLHFKKVKCKCIQEANTLKSDCSNHLERSILARCWTSVNASVLQTRVCHLYSSNCNYFSKQSFPRLISGKWKWEKQLQWCWHIRSYWGRAALFIWSAISTTAKWSVWERLKQLSCSQAAQYSWELRPYRIIFTLRFTLNANIQYQRRTCVL